MNHTRPLDVVIVGGSNAGLMAGILLRRQGHNVRILEQAASNERQALAAGIGLAQQTRDFFELHDRLENESMGVMNEELLCVDSEMTTKFKLRLNQRMTTWDKTYYRLRANFDCFASRHCPKPPQPSPGQVEGEGMYELGIKVLDVKTRGSDRMTVVAEDTKTGITEAYQCDIVVAADGANSCIRRQLNPDVRREEPGYLIWRGTSPVDQLSPRTVEKITGKAMMFVQKHFYCISYIIPGDYGSLAPDSQHVNFAAYAWPFAPISEIMTDIDGHQHRTTIPIGKLRPEIWAKQMQTFQQLLPPELLDVVQNIRHPFVSVISSISSPRAAYMDNRLFLIGDALTQTQPNLGMGTSLAALGAMTLANTIGSVGEGRPDDSKVQSWNDQLVAYTELIRIRSAAFGSWYLCSWPSILRCYARFFATQCIYWWQGKPYSIKGAPMS